MSSRLNRVDHKESHKHEKGYVATASGHGVDKSMCAHGTHGGSGAPKAETGKPHAGMAMDESTPLDDERGSN